MLNAQPVILNAQLVILNEVKDLSGEHSEVREILQPRRRVFRMTLKLCDRCAREQGPALSRIAALMASP
jgi:hypothetical protein